MRRTLIALGAALALFAPAVASADTAADYNLFVLKDMAYRGSDTEGRVAVGGNANLSSYSVGDKAAANTVNLVVGGNIVANGGSTKGQTIIGGTRSYTNWSTAGVQPAGTPLPVDFAAEGQRLLTLSQYLDTYANTGTAVVQYCGTPGSNGCQVTFNALSAGLNVFDIDTSILSDTNTINLNIGANSTVLINVSGTTVRLDGGMAINGVNGGGDSSKVLFNFHDATSFAVGNMDLRGSALAPTADYYGGGGVINGQLIVNSFTGDAWNWQVGGTQVNNVKFAGDLLSLVPPGAVPEPATWALMIGGFGMAGAMLRRQRRVAA